MLEFLKESCRKFAELVDKNTTCCQDNNLSSKIESLDEYQSEALKTFKPELLGKVDEAVKYLGLKLSEEVGEINGPIAKHLYHGKNLDVEHLVEEIGDTLWYLSNLANVFGYKLSDVATRNIEKLRQRHGESYRKEHYQQ